MECCRTINHILPVAVVRMRGMVRDDGLEHLKHMEEMRKS